MNEFSKLTKMTKASRWTWIISSVAVTGAALVLAFMLAIANTKAAPVTATLEMIQVQRLALVILVSLENSFKTVQRVREI